MGMPDAIDSDRRVSDPVAGPPDLSCRNTGAPGVLEGVARITGSRISEAEVPVRARPVDPPRSLTIGFLAKRTPTRHGFRIAVPAGDPVHGLPAQSCLPAERFGVQVAPGQDSRARDLPRG